MTNWEKYSYDELTKFQQEISARKKDLEGSFKKGQVVLFEPRVQSGKKIQIHATVQGFRGHNIVVYCHGNENFPESICITSGSKLRHYDGNEVKPKEALRNFRDEGFMGSLPVFRECTNCGIDAKAGSCNCFHWSGATNY